MKTIVLLARVIFIAVIALLILRFVAVAQGPQTRDLAVDPATKTSVIDNIIKEMNDAYVFAETAKLMEADLKQRLANKEYGSITSGQEFASKLTADLQSVSKDKHLRVRFSPDPIPVQKERGEPSDEEKALDLWSSRRVNFGFERVERLQGNIGYLDLRGFSGHQASRETVESAMSFLANTESLIIDLRNNGGGSPIMVAFLSSYFFGDKPVHLNSLYWRKGNKTDEFWTKPSVPGKKYGNKDIYILTSNRTFSAAEEFTYNLKNLKRATVIGETTGGGAHPGGNLRVGLHFRAFIPSGRAINPISKTNWEGTGVEPDIKVPKEQALKVAYAAALARSLDSIKDPNVKDGVQELIDQTKKELEDLKKTAKGN